MSITERLCLSIESTHAQIINVLNGGLTQRIIKLNIRQLYIVTIRNVGSVPTRDGQHVHPNDRFQITRAPKVNTLLVNCSLHQAAVGQEATLNYLL